MTCRCDPARRPKRSNGSNGVKRPFWAGGVAPRSNGSNREMLSAEGQLSLNGSNGIRFSKSQGETMQGAQPLGLARRHPISDAAHSTISRARRRGRSVRVQVGQQSAELARAQTTASTRTRRPPSVYSGTIGWPLLSTRGPHPDGTQRQPSVRGFYRGMCAQSTASAVVRASDIDR